MSEILISLPKPHPAQLQILKEAKRFNILCNGRRWGKTTLAIRLLKPAITHRKKIGYWSPTYKDLAEVWAETKYRLHDIIQKKDEQLKQIVLVTGSIIDFWSMEEPDSGRGRSYHRVILDEFEKAKKGKEAWENTIRPTLTDFIGDMWTLSTPKGINSYFYKMYENRNEFANWMGWQMPTRSNPYIEPSEIDEAKSQLDPIIFRQEYEAEFVSTSDKPFMYAFDDKHIVNNIVHNPKLTTYFSFDFNVDPITCIVAQHSHTENYIHILDEFRLNDSNTYDLCDRIISSPYGKSFKMVTGDASGMARSTIAKGSINNYTIICQKLGLNPDGQLALPGRNPPIDESRTLCNAIFYNHPSIKVHERCKYLIEDLRFVQVNDKGDIDKNQNAHRSHLMDALRYYLNSFWGNFVTQNI